MKTFCYLIILLLSLSVTLNAQQIVAPISSEEWTKIFIAVGAKPSAKKDFPETLFKVAHSLYLSSASPEASPKVTRSESFQLAPEAIRRSQGNTAMNQWAKLGCVVDSTPTPTPNPDDLKRVKIGSVLMMWYALEIHLPFQNDKEKSMWLESRLIIAQLCREIRLEFPDAVEGSWTSLLSTAHVLDLPSAQFPE